MPLVARHIMGFPMHPSTVTEEMVLVLLESRDTAAAAPAGSSAGSGELAMPEKADLACDGWAGCACKQPRDCGSLAWPLP